MRSVIHAMFITWVWSLAACTGTSNPNGDDTDPGSDTDSDPATDADGDRYTAAEDCDDGDASVHPGATEICDGADNDCDGDVDEPDAADVTTWFSDVDGDGFGNSAAPVEACAAPSGAVADDTDCDDGAAAVNPVASERCNGVDDDCDSDVDEPDSVDASTWYADTDGDGFGDPMTADVACSGPPDAVVDGGDCDDGRADVNPEAAELCDGLDDDCDGELDESDAVDAPAWYTDADGDGFGDPASMSVACDAPAGALADDTDCDDTLAATNPAATESCDAIDNDCDGTVDEPGAVDAPSWYADADGDGFGDPASSTIACTMPAGYLSDSTDCDDGEGDVNPAASELCDGVDDDCDGAVDEPDAADARTWYADADGDGHGDATASEVACTAPSGYLADDTDCDDLDAAVSPTAAESCNSVDDDCDGSVDEADAVDMTTWYADADGDGYGDATVTSVACSAPVGTVGDGSDCDDTDTDVHPGASEFCDGVDRSCDGVAPSGLAVPSDYATITEAISAAVAGDTICVSAGTYVEQVDFRSKDVTLLGAGATSTFIDASAGYIAMTTGELSGFTVENATGAAENYGGAFRCDNSSGTPVVEHVTFADNTCSGAIAYADDCDLTLRDVTFEDNVTATRSSSSGNLYGALLYTRESVITIDGLVATNNSVTAASYAYGGLLYSYRDTNLSWDDVELESNTISARYAHGGLISVVSATAATIEHLNVRDNTVEAESILGGVFYSASASPELYWVDMRANTIDAGTGGEVYGGLSYTHSDEQTWWQWIAADNSISAGEVRGGAYYAWLSSSTSLYVYHADFYANVIAGSTTHGVYGGILYTDYTYPRGSYLYLDDVNIVSTVTSGTVYGSVLYSDSPYTTADFDYCNIYDNAGTTFYGMADPTGTGRNIAVDPGYTDVSASSSADWDLTLDAGSLVLGEGTSGTDIGAYGGVYGSGW